MREDITFTAKEAVDSPDFKDKAYEPNEIEVGRLFKLMAEFVAGFNILKKYCLAATIFGTARCSFDDDVYKKAKELAARLAKDDFTIISGGGRGVMQAANRGAKEAGGDSVGLNIELPYEQQINEYITDMQSFHYFFIRKVMLSFASEVYIFMPGGFGTMDEFFEIVTLIQTKKIQRIPVILVGKEYWTPLLSWINETLYEKNHAIDKEDMEIYHLVDSVDEAYDKIRELLPIDQLKAC